MRLVQEFMICAASVITLKIVETYGIQLEIYRDVKQRSTLVLIMVQTIYTWLFFWGVSSNSS